MPGLEDDVENDGIIFCVGLVQVRGPFFGMLVQFDVATKERAANAYRCPGEVGPAVAVCLAGGKDLDRPSVGCCKRRRLELLIFPELPQETLRNVSGWVSFCHRASSNGVASRKRGKLFIYWLIPW